MIRTLTVTPAMTLQSLRRAVIDPKLRPEQADAAFAKLKEMNPHADLTSLQAGSVIFLPDIAGITSQAATAVLAGPTGDIRGLVTAAVNSAARDVKTGLAARRKERDDVSAAFESAPFKSAAANDPELARLADTATKAAAAEEKDDTDAAEVVAEASKALLLSLDELEKLID